METYSAITDLSTCEDQAYKLFNEAPEDSPICNNATLYDVEFEMVNHPFWVTEKSDGVVLTGSQQALPDPTLITQTIFNSSHMQIRNDANTKASLLLLFNDDISKDSESGNWFETDVR